MADVFQSKNGRKTTESEDMQKLTAQSPAESHHTLQMALLSAVNWLKASVSHIEDSWCSPLIRSSSTSGKGMPREDRR